MIERYTRPEMGALWADEARFQSWLEVELAVCEVMTERGVIPTNASSMFLLLTFLSSCQLVLTIGFEPMTSSLPRKCSTN